MDDKIQFSTEFIQLARNTLQIDGELMFVGDGTSGNPYISNGMVWVHQRDEVGLIVKIEAVELPVGTGVELSAGTAVIVGTNRERKRGIISMSADGLKRQGKNIYQYNPLDINLAHGFGRHDFTMMQISATQPLSSVVRINQMVWVNRRSHHENINSTPGFIEIDLSTSIPSANEHRLSTIFFDPLAGAFGVSDGTPKSILDQMTNADISETLPALPANSIPIFCLRLIGGDVAINPIYGRNLWLDMRQLINLPDATDRLSFNHGDVLTIDNGVIDASFTIHKVKAESGLTDDLEHINGAESGQLLILKSDANNTITITNTGNIKLPKNVVLHEDNILTLVYMNGDWHSLAYQSSQQNLWGAITGTLSDQIDLQSALDAKLDADDYDPVTIGASANGLSITDQTLTLDLADDTNAGAMPSAMFNLLAEGRVYLGSQLFTSSGTFSKASFPTAKWFKVTMVGGGGGGSSTHLATMCGSGGAGSPYCIRWIDAEDMLALEAVTVGNGGNGGAAGGNAGSAGGHSIFMGTTSGLGNGAGSTSAFNQGGASIAGSGLSDLRCFGSGGQSGGNVAGVGSGMGGSNAFGGGAPGRPAQANQPSLDGYIYGGGGAGATHTSRAGGNGAQGMILIEAYG